MSTPGPPCHQLWLLLPPGQVSGCAVIRLPSTLPSAAAGLGTGYDNQYVARAGHNDATSTAWVPWVTVRVPQRNGLSVVSKYCVQRVGRPPTAGKARNYLARMVA